MSVGEADGNWVGAGVQDEGEEELVVPGCHPEEEVDEGRVSVTW